LEVLERKRNQRRKEGKKQTPIFQNKINYVSEVVKTLFFIQLFIFVFLLFFLTCADQWKARQVVM
jgi:hypothetical protein